MHPIRLIPTLHQRPWGVASLRPWLDVVADEHPIGEAWFTDGCALTPDGRTLGQRIAADPRGILGPETTGDRCPLLMKLLFTTERLSIQVHPDDPYARAHHDSPGKTEAWHVLDATPAAEVGLGFVDPVDAETARRAALSGELADLVHWRRAARGDTFLVPARTVHAIGGGLTIVEVQQQSDVTYRLFDYGRPRELHLEHGFAVASLGRYALANAPTVVSPTRTRLTTCDYFTMESIALVEPARVVPTGVTFQLMMAIEGSGTLAGEPFAPGTAWILPATGEPVGLDTGGCRLLLAAPVAAPCPILQP